MSLPRGTRLGPYEVLAPLGAGGMGEIYRARDTRLGRDVAIKVLHPHLSTSAEDRARFKREAKTISSLNHPHICVLHDVGQEGDTDYLVMELVEGETLAQRIERGSLPMADLLTIGIQVADALDRAHGAGVIHRDLKPGNVMLTKSGAKLMDFGLARMPARGRGGTADITATAPTGTQELDEPITTKGTILGTFRYMAPEQLEGKSADVRSDLWALGCLLYEMAARRPAFEGSTSASLISAIMGDRPRELADAAPTTPPALLHVVNQCLMKDPDERWQTAGDLRRELQWIANSGAPPDTTPFERPPSTWLVVAVTALAVLGLMVLRRPTHPVSEPIRFAIPAPPGSFMTESPSDVAISPDGRVIAYVGGDSTGHRGLWLRRLSDLTPTFLAGTSGAIYPFWSPDGRNIAFFADGKLKRVAALGGTVGVVCDAPDSRGGSWGSRGVIVFCPSVTSDLQQVDADGGSPSAATKAVDASGHFPCFLPDGRHFLFLGRGQAIVGALGSSKQTSVLQTSRVPIYAPPGYLVFAKGGSIVAQPFNTTALRLEGNPVRLSNIVPVATQNIGERVATVSSTGILVFPTTRVGNSQLVWSDIHGKTLGTQPLPPGSFDGPRLSPDGKRVVMTEESGDERFSIWIYDILRSRAERLTFGDNSDRSPIWSPDGTRILYGSNRPGGVSLCVRPAGAAGNDSVLFTSPQGWIDPSSWSPTGDFITFRRVMSSRAGFDIWVLPMRGRRIPTPYLQTPADEGRSSISPDGRWLAYESNELGRFEIYVQSFPNSGVKYQVSSKGGRSPSWSRDGRELFYEDSEGNTVSVPVRGEATLQLGPPAAPSKRAPFGKALDTPSGIRFLGIRQVSSDEVQSLTVVQNWPEIARGRKDP